MKTKYLLAAATAALLTISSVQAVQITGTIRMAGSVTLNTTDLSTADNTTAFGVVFVTTGDGSYTGTAGNLVTWKNFGWNPSTAPVNDLWKFTYLGNAYTFDLANITSVSQSVTDLVVKGKGTVEISGGFYDPTFADWSFSITDTSGGTSGSFVFGFSDSNTAIPDGGTTVMLLGAALSTLGLIRRKIA
ncbi:MAG: hypothetical protein H7Y43_01670 [Akkermansiaceae bacterium]|nr:hypothetical protein [Verrucomicrobiales bacterium]